MTENRIAAERKIEMMAEEFDWPVDDLLDWYKNDMQDIERMAISEVRFIVADYIENHKACRGGEA